MRVVKKNLLMPLFLKVGHPSNFLYQGTLSMHIRRLASNVAVKLGNAYLHCQNRQPATCFQLKETMASLMIPVLPVKWKALKDLLRGIVKISTYAIKLKIKKKNGSQSVYD